MRRLVTMYYISYLVTLMKRREKRPILGRDIHLKRQGNSLQMKNDAGTMMQMKMVNYAEIFASRFSCGGVQKSSLFST